MWSAIENSVSVTDPTAVLHSRLVSALSTLGDAQYWEESISPAVVRQSLQEADPSSPSSTPTLLRGMKWLLANISKGRDVSDFYVVVVKLVACPVTEVRKMVYTYLVQYADHNAETQELSLLSINSFQRGLSDHEPLIRALALRVLTSVQLPDILAIQILAVTKHAQKDGSPYVRKCAAVAVAKLAPRCRVGASGGDQRAILLELVQHLLDYDRTTMVLSSALVAYAELTGADVTTLHMLHGCFRKLCHLLTDMDEWGQVVCLEVLTRYTRHFFREPVHYATGSAEQIDVSRRVVRKLMADGRITTVAAVVTANRSSSGAAPTSATATAAAAGGMGETPAEKAAAAGVSLPLRRENRHVVKRRVVKKGFYSDEEDESIEEEVYADTLAANHNNGPLSSKLRQRNVVGGGGGSDGVDGNNNNRNIVVGGKTALNPFDDEETDLDEDHRFLLRSAMSLLKSRNAGVVLAVCSLQYYCGVSSIPVRKAIGKALVRIHRTKHREIQYVVLTSIRKLVQECPSAFSPFLHDFYVLPDMDPPFTRLIKLDILTSLALDPPSIAAVLKELRTYIQLQHNSDEYTDDDTAFVCAAVRAVGRVAEMARIVFDRHGRGSAKQRAEADTIALNCLYGLVTLSQTADHEMIVGETVTVMQRILQMLRSDGKLVYDPNQVQDRALRCILLLLVNTLSCVVDEDEESERDLEEDVDDAVKSDQVTLVLPPSASAAALWLIGEYLSPLSSNSAASFGKMDSSGRSKVRLELARSLVRCFQELDIPEKEQAIHFASKLLLSRDDFMHAQEGPLCEQLLAMGRVDNNSDVRDRARYESMVIDRTVGLQHDREALDEAPMRLRNTKKLTMEDAKQIFLSSKPASSYLPLENENSSRGGSTDHSGKDGDGCFRFGTLSSLVGHRARSAYLPLPTWADTNSPSSLREPPEEKREEQPAGSDQGYMLGKHAGFYKSSDNENESSASKSSSSDSESESDSSDESSSETNGDDSSVDVQQVGILLPGTQPAAQHLMPVKSNDSSIQHQPIIRVESATDESSSGESDSDGSSKGSGTSAEELFPNSSVGTLIPMGDNASSLVHLSNVPFASVGNGSSVADDMKGLVLAPVVVDPTEPTDSNVDRDSSVWIPLIRPDHAGGLLAEYRYLRGVTKAQQVQMMGLTSEKPTVVCLQIRFENQKEQGGASIRHIRILQRASTSSGSAIGVRKIVLPLEISELPVGRRAECFVGIDFASASDRESFMQAKLEVKFGSGGTTVEIKPTIGDLLLPCKRSIDEFDAAVSRMQGFHRAESNFSVSESSLAVLPIRFLSRAALSVVGASKPSWDDSNKIRLVGTLPASSDPVYVLATNSVSGQGKITVCCEHTLVANSIMNLLKRAISD